MTKAAMIEATGAVAEIELVAGKEPGEMWDLVTDVSRIGEWSPECTGGAWLDGPSSGSPAAATTGPQPGAWFKGRNEFSSGFTSTVTCVVTEAERPAVFEWIVLDPSADPAQPGSIWRYELTPGPAAGQTTVRHTFTHGSGRTGLSEGMRAEPEQAAAILAGRLETLRTHMRITLERMAGVSGGGTGPECRR